VLLETEVQHVAQPQDQQAEDQQTPDDAEDLAERLVTYEAEEEDAGLVEGVRDDGGDEALDVAGSEAVVAPAESGELGAGQSGGRAVDERLDEALGEDDRHPEGRVGRALGSGADEVPVDDQGLDRREGNTRDHPERQSVHEVVELRAAREEEWADLLEDLRDDRDEDDKDEQIAEPGSRAATVQTTEGDLERQDVEPEQREQHAEDAREHEGGDGDRHRLVLPEVHVVDVDDVDDRNGEGGDHQRDRHGPEDRGEQRSRERENEGQLVGLWTLTCPSGHDGGDERERGHWLVRLGRERLTSLHVGTAQVIATPVAEVRSLRDRGMAALTFHVPTPSCSS